MDLSDIKPGMPLNRVHAEYGALSDEDKLRIGLEKLTSYIDKGRDKAARVVQAILDEQPRDRYVPAGRLGFKVVESNGPRPQIQVLVGEEGARIHRYALDQAAERVGINLRFLHGLVDKGEPWAANLAAHNMNVLLNHQPANTKYLVRQVGGEVRGVLSSAYKRIDSRPTVDALIQASDSAGAKVVDGIFTPTRVSLKVVKAEPVEIFPGEYAVFGLDYSNSDFGDGATEFSAFILRLICLNGAVSVRELRKIHIGARFQGDEHASERTLRLNAAAQASIARDQVSALLSPAATENLVSQIRKANSIEVSPAKIKAFLKTRVNKTEEEEIVKKFASADIVEVPAGQTNWRFSNAISWLARGTEDGRRRMELERIAGEAAAA
jgi:hypothetical protein